MLRYAELRYVELRFRYATLRDVAFRDTVTLKALITRIFTSRTRDSQLFVSL